VLIYHDAGSAVSLQTQYVLCWNESRTYISAPREWVFDILCSCVGHGLGCFLMVKLTRDGKNHGFEKMETLNLFLHLFFGMVI